MSDQALQPTRLSAILMFILLVDYTELAEDDMIANLTSDHYVMFCGGPEQRDRAAQKCTNGDEAQLQTLFERNIINSGKELGFDPVYIQRRFRMAARGERISDVPLSQYERESLREQDVEAFDILSLDKRNEKSLAVLKPYLDRWSSSSSSSMLLVPCSSTTSPSGDQHSSLLRARKHKGVE